MRRDHLFSFLLVGIAFSLPPRFVSAEDAVRPARLSPMELAEWIDARLAKYWEQQSLVLTPVVDDATFLRRAYLDLLGTIPSVSYTRDFLNDPGTHKREELIGSLLRDERSPEHLARVWRRVIVPAGSAEAMAATRLEPWLTEQFANNVPYDEFARNLLTTTSGADSDADGESPVVFYQVIGNEPDALADAVSRIFLGVRLGCAKCHDHPFALWEQKDFWGMAAFFAGGRSGNSPTMADNTRRVTIRPMDSETEFAARFLWTEQEAEIPVGKFPRDVLAEWMTSRENPNFATTAVNRVWQHLCGRGLVGTVDNLDQVTREERAVLLDDLARKFVQADFDLHWLIRGICLSRTYQRASAASQADSDSQVALMRPLKTLTPEQVFDSLEQALMLPVSNNPASPRYNGQRTRLVARLNEASADAPDQFRAGIPQALMMMNGKLIADATDLEESRTLRAVVDAPFLDPAEKIETLFLAAFTRKPSPKEQQAFLKYLRNQSSESERRQAYAEIFWALLNSPEFVLSR